MATTIDLYETPERDPSTLTYADLTGGVEPDAFIPFNLSGGIVYLIHFNTADLNPDQIANVRARAEGSSATDDLRNDVLEAAPAIQTIINSTGTLTTAQLSDAVRALAKATFALGRLVLRG